MPFKRAVRLRSHRSERKASGLRLTPTLSRNPVRTLSRREPFGHRRPHREISNLSGLGASIVASRCCQEARELPRACLSLADVWLFLVSVHWLLEGASRVGGRQRRNVPAFTPGAVFCVNVA